MLQISSVTCLGRKSFGAAIFTITACMMVPSLHSQSASLIGGEHVLHMQEEQKTQAAEAHQKKMVSDADRLVELAQQLKVSVDKTNKNIISVDVLRNAEKIEKLARELREGVKR